MTRPATAHLAPAPTTDPPYEHRSTGYTGYTGYLLPATGSDPTRPAGRRHVAAYAPSRRGSVQQTLGITVDPAARRRLLVSASDTDLAAARPDVRRWTALFLQGVLEVASAERPFAQLARWTSLEVYEQLQWELALRRKAATEAGVTALRAGQRPVRGRGARLLSVHVTPITDDAAEACATVRWPSRIQAVALRIEAHAGGWRCTALVFC